MEAAACFAFIAAFCFLAGFRVAWAIQRACYASRLREAGDLVDETLDALEALNRREVAGRN